MLLRKGVYPYEYMDTWEKLNEALLSKKEDFYSSLNLEIITSVNYRHVKRLLKNFNGKNIGDHHDLYAWSNTLLIADWFENLRNKCI